MDKLKMHSVNKVDENVEKIKKLFPNCVTERKNKDGETVLGVDFEMLKQELSSVVIDKNEERYQFTWPDKKQAILAANAPIAKTLRPCREESVDFDKTENLYIEGDNLDVLKLLQETYLGKFNTIYIDPPYNTGVNLIYHNDFHQSATEYLASSGQFDEEGNMLVKNPTTNGRYHTNWLNMITPRLRLSKDLLSEDGILVLTIDDYEIQTVTMILNEIFGEENHLATIIIKNNPSGRSTLTGASISHEYALFYAKNNSTHLGRLQRNDKQIARYKEEDEIGRYEWVNFRKHGGYKEDAPTMYYPIFIKKDASDFRIPKLKWNDSAKEYNILEEPRKDELVSYPIDENGRPRRWKWSLDRALSERSEMTVRLDKDKVPAVYIKARMKDEGMLPLTVWDDKLYSSTEYGTNLLIELLGDKYFDYPKSLYAVKDCLRIASNKNDGYVLDFFSGSATTAHAILELNAEDGGSRKFVMVQVPEDTYEGSVARKAGYKNICEIGKERIRRAGQKIKESLEESGVQLKMAKEGGPYSQLILKDGAKKGSTNPDDYDILSGQRNIFDTQADLKEQNKAMADKLDVGFRVLKLDSSNMEDVYYNPSEVGQISWNSLTENIKADRTPEDLLFQVMLDLGVFLSEKIEETTINGRKVFKVAGNYLIACFDKNVDDETVKEIAKQKPYYFVMRDSSMANDSVATNFDQIFKTYSPETVKKIL